MSCNETAKGALETYLENEKPGYALLVDAPWGAGKTHFVKEVCDAYFEKKNDQSESYRYVTLNGVSNETEFRRALLKNSFRIDGSSSKKSAGNALNIGEKISNLFSKQFGVPGGGSLAREIIEETLISSLPGTLVFDDIERSVIDIQVLLGLLNDFVEHEEKRVVLLVNSEAHERKDEFLEKKEKIVGRTLKLTADFEAAYKDFVDKISEGRGKTYFDGHRDVARQVFDQAGHQNLRLLRNAMRECALVLDQIEDDLFEAKEPMDRFVRTYLALAMALAKGELTESHIKERDKLFDLICDAKEGDPWYPVKLVCARHQGAEIRTHAGALFSLELGIGFFVDGFIDSKTLNHRLRSTGQFEPEDENPLWKRWIFWGQNSLAEVEQIVDESERYLFETEPIDPGPYLRIADNMFRIEKLGGLDMAANELKEKILDRLKTLKETGSIRPWSEGFELEEAVRFGNFSYRGYGIELKDEIKEIFDAVNEFLDSQYKRQLPAKASELLELFKTDLKAFNKKIAVDEPGGNYSRTQIFHKVDVNAFAGAFLDHLNEGRLLELMVSFEKISIRHQAESIWLDEQRWFKKLRCELKERASKRSKLAQAQLEYCFACQAFRDLR